MVVWMWEALTRLFFDIGLKGRWPGKVVSGKRLVGNAGAVEITQVVDFHDCPGYFHHFFKPKSGVNSQAIAL
jgi:hypothetical protein